MFTNKAADGRNNLCGLEIARLRTVRKWSQRQMADQLQLIGLNLDKNAIQRIESGQRFITDIEMKAIAALFGCTVDDLYGGE